MGDFKEAVRRRLKVLMAEADMDATELSAASGVSIDAIRKYLRAEAVPLFDTACEISKALGCTPNDLCGWSKEAQ